MSPSRSRDRVLLTLLGGLTLTACAATTAPGASPTTSSAGTAPTGSASAAAPSPSLVVVPSGTPVAVESTAPTDNPVPTGTPLPTERPVPPIAACGTGSTGFAAHRGEIPATLQFGHATIEFTPAGTGMRDGSYDVDDAIPAGVGLSPNEIAVVVAPGDHIILRGSGITIVATEASAVPWSTVRFAGGLADLGTSRTGLAWRVRSDGSLSVSAPSDVGDWAVEFVPRWHGDCLRGDGAAYARIKVR